MSYLAYARDMGQIASKSAFGVNVLESIGLGQIAADAITMTMDIAESQNQLNLFAAEYGKILQDTQEFTKVMTKSGYNILKDANAGFQNAIGNVGNWTRAKALAQKGNMGASSMIFTQRLNYLAAKMHLDFYAKMLFDMPESVGIRKVQKWYNAAFPTEEPSEGDMIIMVANGFKTGAEVITKYQEDMSFSQADATNLAKIRNWQVGVPSLSDAWRLVQRGLWLRSDWQYLATLGHGFTKEDANAMYELFNYVPSIGDVMSLSNLIPLDPIWVAQAFQRVGMSTTDQAVFVAAMNKKIITQEIRTMWSQILQVYAYGGYTALELEALLRGWQFTDAEITIKIETAELVKTKQVDSLMRDADIYLARVGTIDWDELYVRLIAQDIPEDVANAITRNEACKKGVDWELTP
jgi:hypothetical protein